TTSPAVIKVTSTQPGTSPRSSSCRAAIASRRARGIHLLFIGVTATPSIDSCDSADAEPEHEHAREDREDHREREDEEHQRQEHHDLLAPGLLDQRALRVLARVAGLRLQHLRERRAALEDR